MVTKKPPGNKSSGGWFSAIIKTSGDAQQTALNKAPADHAGTLQLGFVSLLIALGVGAILVYKEQYALGAGIIIVALLVAGLGMILLRPRLALAKPDDAIPVAPTWARTAIKLPIGPVDTRQLSDKLEQIRGEAQTKYESLLRARRPAARDIDSARVRINVFMPRAHGAERGEVCGMEIPENLCHGMRDPVERRIRFRPNEGLTGRVFNMEKAFGALRETEESEWQLIRLEGAGGVGDESFTLTVEQVNQINRALRWIVCFPLKGAVDGLEQTFAVLNIDGLIQSLTAEEMQQVYQRLQGTVNTFATDLWKLPKNIIRITVEDC